MQVVVWDIVDAEVMWRNGGRDGGEEEKGDAEEEEENAWRDESWDKGEEKRREGGR